MAMPRLTQTGIIVCDDNLRFMAGLPDAGCDLIYADPPFGTGKRQTGRNAAQEFSDFWPGGVDGYLAFLRPRLEHFRRLLKATGTLYLHLDWHTVHYVKVYLDKLFGYENMLNEIIWSYRTGGRSTRWFARKHDTILVYARRAGRHRFNLLREGSFRTDGMQVDQDGRPYKNTRAGRLYFHPDGPAMTDVWEIPFLSTVSLERTGYPTQKPEALLERIIQASSNPDDVVADFFCGSGTALAVAQRLGRRWIGCDISPEAVDIARRRLARLMIR
jgi:site-specific DNA-methyltransferase (adenine-specific)